jgi:hypothetical protein
VRAATVPVPTVRVGDCGRPGADGVMSARPDAVRADRDLDGDGAPEVVVADRSLCTAAGNCFWNVFVPAPAGAADRCDRFAGTLEAAALEPAATQGEDRFTDLRGYWNLAGNGRVLVHEYRFRRGGYRLVGAVLCRRAGDDRLECAEQPDGEF